MLRVVAGEAIDLLQGDCCIGGRTARDLRPCDCILDCELVRYRTIQFHGPVECLRALISGEVGVDQFDHRQDVLRFEFADLFQVGDGDALIPAGLGKPGRLEQGAHILGVARDHLLQRGCRGGVAALGDIELDQVVACRAERRFFGHDRLEDLAALLRVAPGQRDQAEQVTRCIVLRVFIDQALGEPAGLAESVFAVIQQAEQQRGIGARGALCIVDQRLECAQGLVAAPALELGHAEAAQDRRPTVVVLQCIAVVALGSGQIAELDVRVAEQCECLGIRLLGGRDAYQHTLGVAGLAKGQQGLCEGLPALDIGAADLDIGREKLERGLELPALERDGPEQQQVARPVRDVLRGKAVDDRRRCGARGVGVLFAPHGLQCLGL